MCFAIIWKYVHIVWCSIVGVGVGGGSRWFYSYRSYRTVVLIIVFKKMWLWFVIAMIYIVLNMIVITFDCLIQVSIIMFWCTLIYGYQWYPGWCSMNRTAIKEKEKKRKVCLRNIVCDIIDFKWLAGQPDPLYTRSIWLLFEWFNKMVN